MRLRVAFKSPIANKPGLYFDQVSRRWKHVPHSEDGEDGWFGAYQNEMDAPRAKARNAVLDHHDRGVLEFKNRHGEHGVVIPDASHPGKWRISRYDRRGFGGHSTHATKHEALTHLAEGGYTEPAKGSLDRMGATEEWAQGTRDAKMMQTVNSIGHAGHSAAASEAWHHYNTHGGSQEALDRIHRREHLDALHRGEVPESLKALDVGDQRTGDLFGHADPTHGGKLHQEQRTDRSGRVQRRWVRTEGQDPGDSQTHDLEAAVHRAKRTERPWADAAPPREQLGLIDAPPPKPPPAKAPPRPSGSLYEQFGHAAAPRPGERGHRVLSQERRRAEQRAAGILARAEILMRDSDGPQIYAAMRRAWGLPPEWGDEGDEWYESEWDPEDLGALIGWPEATAVQAADVLDLALRGSDPVDPLPREVVHAVIADQFAPPGKLRLAHVPREEALDFVRKHHSQMPEPNTRGLMYAVGVKQGGRLVAVATAGTPTGRWANRVSPHNVLELTRIASDGTARNASSMLAARMLDLAPKSTRGGKGGPWLFVTYSLASERGSTYRALREKGLRPVEFVKGKRSGGGGARGGSQTGYAEPDKIRWEAGPAALPARWGLLEG